MRIEKIKVLLLYNFFIQTKIIWKENMIKKIIMYFFEAAALNQKT